MVQWVLCVAMMFAMAVSAGAAEKGTITITDTAGRLVTAPFNPDRIVCLSPGTLRLIIYLQAKDKVAGIEEIEKKFPKVRAYFIANSELAGLPVIGPGGPNSINKEPDLEALLSISPDVIFISYMDKDNADALQRKIGIPVVVLSYGPFGSFDETIFESLRTAGEILNKKERAEDVISFIEQARKDLDDRTSAIAEDKKPSVYVGGIGFKGSHGIESTEANFAPFQWVNAKTLVKAEGAKSHLFVGKEELLVWNPDAIFIDGGGEALIKQDYEKKPDYYNGLKAFKENRVFSLHSYNWYMTNLGTVLADAYAVGKILYPERFEDIDVPVKADEIYTFLLGKPVHAEMVEQQGALGAPPAFIR